MFTPAIIKTWNPRHFQQCGWYLDCPVKKTPPFDIGGFEYVSVERRAESGERRLESGKFRFSWVILGEEVPISVELYIFGFLYLGMHPIPVDIITQNCWRYQRIL